MKTNFLLSLFFSTLFWATKANNISVGNVKLIGKNITAGVNNAANFTTVQFNLSWENSWRTSSAPNNWDAAWVFVKYRVGTGNWQHALLNNTGHTAPAGSTIDVGLQTPGSAFNATTNPGIGAFVYRSANGSGTLSLSNVQLRWNYAANGVLDNDVVDVRVFAIEMVYVPQGSFSVGDASSDSRFCPANSTAGTATFTIGATPPTLQGLSVSSSASNLSFMGSSDIATGTTTSLANGFPTGYKAFYGMKYEITQQGYVDFLNTLTRVQQNTRTGTNLAAGVTSVTNRYVMSNTTAVTNRNGIRCDATIHTSDPITFYCDLNANGTGGQAADGQWLACNFLSYMDVAAYLDWTGLRPMTELEYEKACRGPLTPVAGEYAWGSNSIIGAANITTGGAINETSNTVGANAVYNNNTSVLGPMRVGVFAKGSSTRAQAGAGYYGMMELSGNLWERTVTVGWYKGRQFIGLHGNGQLSVNGNANEFLWPGYDIVDVTNADGSGFRGGTWFDGASRLRVSERLGAGNPDINRTFARGGRGVRSAP